MFLACVHQDQGGNSLSLTDFLYLSASEEDLGPIGFFQECILSGNGGSKRGCAAPGNWSLHEYSHILKHSNKISCTGSKETVIVSVLN
jgi:hypothetical protein